MVSSCNILNICSFVSPSGCRVVLKSHPDYICTLLIAFAFYSLWSSDEKFFNIPSVIKTPVGFLCWWQPQRWSHLHLQKCHNIRRYFQLDVSSFPFFIQMLVLAFWMNVELKIDFSRNIFCLIIEALCLQQDNFPPKFFSTRNDTSALLAMQLSCRPCRGLLIKHPVNKVYLLF